MKSIKTTHKTITYKTWHTDCWNRYLQGYQA